MDRPVKAEHSGDLLSDNGREQPVAALPSGHRRPIRRGMRVIRAADALKSSNTGNPSTQTACDSTASAGGDGLALFSGVHSSAAKSAEDAIRMLSAFESNNEESQTKQANSDDFGFGRRKKRKFSTSKVDHDEDAFAPYQSIVDEDDEVKCINIAANDGAKSEARSETRSPTPPPDIDARYLMGGSSFEEIRNLNSTLGALRRSAPIVSEPLSDVATMAMLPVAVNDLPAKIRHKGSVHRVNMTPTAKVVELVKKFADEQGIASHLVTLWRGDETLSPEHTLQQAGILLTDILDCTVSSETAIGQDGTMERNMVSLKVQDKAKAYHFNIGKSQSLVKLMEMYCEKAGHTLDRAVLMFDGEKLDLNETPAGMDMEDDDVIDATIT